MKKRTIIVILLAVLAVILGIGVLMISQSKKQQAEQAALEQKEREEKEEQEAKLEEQKARLEQEKREAEAKKREEQEAKEAAVKEKEAETVSQDELDGEGQIHKPAGYQMEGTEGMEDLRAQLEGMLAGYEGDWSVYVYDLGLDEYLEINSHEVKAASLIKLYIMGAVLEQVEAGNLTEDEALNQLLTNMITVSDNESSNELVRRLSPDGSNHPQGMEVVNAFASAYGYQDTSQGRDLRDFRDVPAEGENYTSVKDCALFLKRVYDGTCISREASAKMLELLKKQQRTWKIPAGVPNGVVTANKTGELSDTENDVAIIYGPITDYILCVTSTGLSNPGAAQGNIVAISSTVYQYLNEG